MKSRAKFLCICCKVDTGKINEHYMLKDDVWAQVHNNSTGMYCIKCFETKLGRQLTRNDFNDSYVNKFYHNKSYSDRLLNRLKTT